MKNKQIIFNLEESKHTAFKTKVFSEGKLMTAVLNSFIDNYLFEKPIEKQSFFNKLKNIFK